MAILETKFEDRKLMRIMRNKFVGFMQVNNFCTHQAGRILILWNPSKFLLNVMEVHPQIIHVKATCKVTSYASLVSFVYGFHIMVSRRPLWNTIMEINENVSLPWLIIGDYSNVLKFDEKCNEADITPYEIKDLATCCLNVGLSDVHSIGCFFTWTNGSVWSKIDRALVHDVWIQKGTFVEANFLPSGCLSDYSPCIVSIHDRVGRKLCKLKGALKEHNFKHFGHISGRVIEAKDELESAQLQLHNQPTNADFQILVANLRKKTVTLCEAERSFYYQKAKCIFLKDSDKCTKFFHSLVKRNSKRNFIATVLKEDGMYTTSQDEVASEFVKFYTSLLGKKCSFRPIDMDILSNGPLVFPEQGDTLVRDVSHEKIKDALFDIGDDKSPGPDGYTSCFFKNVWEIIGDDFFGAISKFFSSGCILKQINHTAIALVPKSDHMSHVGDYRLISCCNVIYKVIAKIFVSRLRPILRDIVGHAQAAFVEGRSIMENIHLAQELLRQYNRKRVAPRCLLKIDLSKAYDSVCWDFLRNVFVGLQFPSRFVNWIMERVTSTSYSIALNGTLHGFFKSEKGLWQDDLFSPFLFVLCIEYLSRLLKDATYDSDFNFHPKCGPQKINNLAFVDDLMLFAMGDFLSIKILMDCLSKFGSVSGLKLNILKSSLFTAGVHGQILDDIMELTCVPRGSMPFRYLGIPLALDKLKVSGYAPFLDKITSYIGAWNSSTLSYAGSKKSLVAWKDICLPKEEGGLGLKDLKSWNLALLDKSLWKIHNKKDSLWIQWVDHVYLHGSCIWEIFFRGRYTGTGHVVARNISARQDLNDRFFNANLATNSLVHGQTRDGFYGWKMMLFGKQFLQSWTENLDSSINYSTWILITSVFFVAVLRKLLSIFSLSALSHLHYGGALGDDLAKRVAFSSTVYYIWLMRKRKIFEDLSPDLDSIVRLIKTHVYKVMFTLYPDVLIHFESLAVDH
ncbi:uncharacterized protein LOC111389759 [Olea europaea var. sylvestris]|uniref:uncharacterized protein LOC111389759 n=1 Tax=Olea europaea var. sylvestris TaxID=158386 RepID=UPI000C1D453A|nr:uncharacterized protein LOC111389759 [Olea europaea var. sylvestris]